MKNYTMRLDGKKIAFMIANSQKEAMQKVREEYTDFKTCTFINANGDGKTYTA